MPADPNRVRDLFLAAVELRPDQRSDYLVSACGGDADLRAEVERLLLAHADPDSILEPSVPAPTDVTATFGEEPQAPVGATADFVPFGATGTFGGTETRPARSTATELGTVIAGRYALVEVIGEGGMGSVYLASQTEPVKRQVALKLIKSGMDSKGVLARFDAERQALALMDHPNIARIYDGGVTETGQPYFVMELVQGVPLTEYCDAKRLTVDARLQLFVPVCQAVQHAHQKGIIHRDLKPSNVLVTEVDGRPTPKVIDFGVAKATEQKLTDLSFADTGAIVGTPAYMSPEQADPSSMDIDTRTDVYALGVMLYELLTGSPPIDSKQFQRGAILEMLRMVREVEPPKPSTKLSAADALPSIAANRSTEPAKLAKSLQGELDWVVMKALEKDRTRRYETANGLAADVLRYLADEVVEARPPSRAYRLKKFVKRNKVQVVAASLVLLVLVGGIVGTSVGMVTAERQRNRAQDLANKNANLAADEKAAKLKATDLANTNAKLAEDESKAKYEAKKLADDNKKLADDEKIAKNEKEKQLQYTRTVLFNSQMERVNQVRERDPDRAISLLYDLAACPIDMRDFAWRLNERLCRQRRIVQIPHTSNPATASSYPAPPSFLGPMALSPDGRTLAAVNCSNSPSKLPTSNTVTLIATATGTPVADLPEFPDEVHLIVFSPDGKTLAVVADRRALPPNPEKPNEHARIPGKVQLWDVDGLKSVGTMAGHEDRIRALAYSEDGSQLATAADDGTVRVWDVKSRTEKHVLKGHDKEVLAVAFSPDGKRLASGSLDNTIRIWEADTGKLQTTWTATANPVETRDAKGQIIPSPESAHREGVLSLAFSPDGTKLVTGNRNTLIEIRDVAGGHLVTLIRQITTPVRSVFFHRDGKSIIANHQSLSQWDVKTGLKIRTLLGSDRESPDDYELRQGNVSTVSYAAGADRIAIRTRSHFEILSASDSQELARYELDKAQMGTTTPVFGMNGDVLAVAHGKEIQLWDVRGGKIRKTLTGHKNLVSRLAVSPDGRTLASGSVDWSMDPDQQPVGDSIRLWDLASGESLGTIGKPENAIAGVAFSPDGSSIAVLSWWTNERMNKRLGRATVQVWDLKTRERRFEREHPAGAENAPPAVNCVLVFNPTDGTLISGVGRTAYVWDTKSGAVVREFQHGLATQGGFFRCAAVAPDGRTLVVARALGGMDTEMAVWDLTSGTQRKLLYPDPGVIIDSITFSSDGKSLVLAGNGSVWVRDGLTFEVLASTRAHALGQSTAVLHPDGQSFVTVGMKRDLPSEYELRSRGVVCEIKLWDTSRSPIQLVFRDPNPAALYRRIKFSPSGTTLVEPDHAGRTRLWDLRTHRVLSEPEDIRGDIGPVFSPDGRYLVSAGLDGKGQEVARLDFIAQMNSGAFPDFKTVVKLWDTETSRFRRIDGSKGRPVGLSHSPDSRQIAVLIDPNPPSSLVRRAVTLWVTNIDDGKTVLEFPFGRPVPTDKPQPGGLPAPKPSGEQPGLPGLPKPGGGTARPAIPNGKMTFSPDGKFIALVTSNSHVFVLDLDKKELLPPLLNPTVSGGESSIFALEFSKDGSRLIVRRGQDTKSHVVWNWREGKQVNEPIPNATTNSPGSPDGRYELQVKPYGVELIDRKALPVGVRP